jgi:hypothetical protein
MAKRAPLMDDVLANLPKKGTTPWHLKLPPDLLDELRQVKAAFEAGAMPKATRTGLAFALSKSLKARGIDIGHRGVEAWLQTKN